jgi:hypothetical protein
MDVGLSDTRIGMIAYAFHASLEFDLKKYSNIDELTRAIGNVKYTRGGTSTGAALTRARTLLNSQSEEGARSDVPQMLVLLTGISIVTLSVFVTATCILIHLHNNVECRACNINFYRWLFG